MTDHTNNSKSKLYSYIKSKIIPDLEKKKFKPSPNDCILDITDVKNDIYIEHHMEINEPINVIILTNRDKSDVTIYMRQITNKKVIKTFNTVPFILNLTDAKLVLIDYNIEFIIDGETEESKLITPIFSNEIYSMYNSNIVLNNKSKKPIEKIQSHTMITIEDFNKVNETYLYQIKKLIMSSKKDSLKKIVQIRESFPNNITLSDNNLNKSVRLIETRRYINYAKTGYESNKKYLFSSFNGLLFGICSDGFIDTNIIINSEIRFNSRSVSGIIGGYVRTIQNTNLIINGSITLSDHKESHMIGIMSGISRWIDNVNIVVNDKIIVNGNIIGLISGSASGIFNKINVDIKNDLKVNTKIGFGSVVGCLTTVPDVNDDIIDNNDEEHISLLKNGKDSDEFSFINKLIVKNNECKKYQIIGTNNDTKSDDIINQYQDENNSNESDESDNFDQTESKSDESDELIPISIPEQEHKNKEIVRPKTYNSKDTFEYIKQLREKVGLSTTDFPIIKTEPESSSSKPKVTKDIKDKPKKKYVKITKSKLNKSKSNKYKK